MDGIIVSIPVFIPFSQRFQALTEVTAMRLRDATALLSYRARPDNLPANTIQLRGICKHHAKT